MGHTHGVTTPAPDQNPPLSVPAGASIFSDSPSGQRQAVVQISVLVVDDSALIRSMVGTHLAQRGFLVVRAGDGAEALAALAVRKFDLLITDLEMPHLDGHALLAAVQDQYPLMRRIVMTGYTTVENALDALKLGAVGFVPKPVDLRVVDEVVDLAVSEMRSWMKQLSTIRKLRRQQDG